MNIEDIKIVPHKFSITSWYKNDGTYLGQINNEHELNRLRVDLVKHNLTQECYFMWNDIKITIDENGNLRNWPKGFHDSSIEILAELLSLRINKLKNKEA